MPNQSPVQRASRKPVVMCISGLDPTGGAGIQADIETLFSLGCHAAPILSVSTVQNSQNVLSLSAVEPDLIGKQARVVLADMAVACIKLGLLPSQAVIQAVHELLLSVPSIPVVIDPVLVAGGGLPLSDAGAAALVRRLIVPLAAVITPNTNELQQLVPEAKDLNKAAAILLDEGCKAVLLTGTHASTDDVENRLYLVDGSVTVKSWPRLPHSYHGSGCTLASAVAAGIAQNQDLIRVNEQAQAFTWQALKQGERLGHGQWFPNRHLSPLPRD